MIYLFPDETAAPVAVKSLNQTAPARPILARIGAMSRVMRARHPCLPGAGVEEDGLANGTSKRAGKWRNSNNIRSSGAPFVICSD